VIKVDLRGETAYLYWKLNLFNPIFAVKRAVYGDYLRRIMQTFAQ